MVAGFCQQDIMVSRTEGTSVELERRKTSQDTVFSELELVCCRSYKDVPLSYRRFVACNGM